MFPCKGNIVLTIELLVASNKTLLHINRTEEKIIAPIVAWISGTNVFFTVVK